MGLDRWTAFAERHRSLVVLTALLVTFGAVALVLDRPKGAVEMWFALPLFAAGAALFVGRARENLKACDDVASTDTVQSEFTKVSVAPEFARALREPLG